ncbi:hypothetical protein EXM65_05010 [Clostridium botulinum]|uniref:ApeA N-terminal domain-containing protein n=1 Tax=Clostridium botulinum TaxID=1491 RepID=A0A6M0SNE4_CLOBO|nr:hypothetical protein [Clostridium botulinum]
MIKGLIEYKDSKIPFVIKDYKMELFSEDELVFQFVKDNNLKNNYILNGKCYVSDNTPRKITIMVEKSMGGTCDLTCYLIDGINSEKKIDTIDFESKLLDSIFRYKYNYLDLSRAGFNLSLEQAEIYSLPFQIKDNDYTLKYIIGQNNSIGLLDSFKLCGKVSIDLHENCIEEFYKITLLLCRFIKFLTSFSDVTFERITLRSNSLNKAFFYCKYISDDFTIDLDIMFCKFDVQKYISPILNNIALDLGAKISKSIPLGHISNYEKAYTPNRFIEQINAFEYLFEKLEPEKSKDRRFTLKNELQFMFDVFPEVLSQSKTTSEEIAKDIKKLRINIVHGYEYYYDFTSNINAQRCIIRLADLIQRMSLKLIGFTNNEINEFRESVLLF